MEAFLKVFDIFPGWVWAAALAVVVLVSGGTVTVYALETAAAKTDTAKAYRELYEERTAHAKALAEQTLLVLKVTNELNTARAVQEKKDGDAQATIAALGEDLRRRSRAAGGHGLRDPNAAPCSGQSSAGPGPVADAGGKDAAETGGVLSEPLERLLLEDYADADAINVAYASCRADALNLRASLGRLQHAAPATAP